jgi:hypothetical protein
MRIMVMKYVVPIFLMVMLAALSCSSCAKEKTEDKEPPQENQLEEKEETALKIKLPYFTVKLYGFSPAEEGTPQGYESMEANRSDIVEDVTINYELWDYMGMYGSPFNGRLKIVPGERAFTIVKIDQRYTTTLFVNMEGTGASWPMDGVDRPTSEWMKVEKTGELTYRTLKQEEMDKKKPPISAESYRNADEHIKDAKPPMEYSEYTLNAKIRITWTAPQEDTFTTTLNFDYIYGD